MAADRGFGSQEKGAFSVNNGYKFNTTLTDSENSRLFLLPVDSKSSPEND